MKDQSHGLRNLESPCRKAEDESHYGGKSPQQPLDMASKLFRVENFQDPIKYKQAKMNQTINQTTDRSAPLFRQKPQKPSVG